MITLFLLNTFVSIPLDTGCEVKIVDEATYNSLKRKPVLEKCTTTLRAYNARAQIETIGQFPADVAVNHLSRRVLFVVTKGKAGNLLSYNTARDLQIVCDIKCVNNVTDSSDTEHDQWRARFPRVFEERVCKLDNIQAKLHINPNIIPRAQKIRFIPFHLRGPVEAALIKMLDNDIIEPVSGPTPGNVSFISYFLISYFLFVFVE